MQQPKKYCNSITCFQCLISLFLPFLMPSHTESFKDVPCIRNAEACFGKVNIVYILIELETSSLSSARKTLFSTTRAISDFYANRGGQKIAFILTEGQNRRKEDGRERPEDEGVRWVTLHDATLTVSNDESPYFHSSPLPHPVAVPEACRLGNKVKPSSTAPAPPLAPLPLNGGPHG
ncbi:hypothetical protein T06_13510 [Trichinella sp. T6]|nr:hypothetical protein T06_13510 [Trichinella sp. T6]